MESSSPPPSAAPREIHRRSTETREDDEIPHRRNKLLAVTFTSEILQTLVDEEATVCLVAAPLPDTQNHKVLVALICAR